jgi:hypothetical protein
VDELHDTSHLTDETWQTLTHHYNTPQLLELLVLTGWYRAISYVANATHLTNEPWTLPYPA